MTILNIPLEISIYLDTPTNIVLYINDNEHPSHSVSLDSLIDEWVDSFSNEQGIAPAHVEEAETLIAHLRETIEIIRSSLPQ